MTSPKKKPALGKAMKQARNEATVKDVEARAQQLAAACKTLKVSHKGPMDVLNEVLFRDLPVPEALAALEQISTLLESIAAADARIPSSKQKSAARLKKDTLAAYLDLELWKKAAVNYQYVVMTTAAKDAQGRVDWKAGRTPGRERSGPVLGSRT